MTDVEPEVLTVTATATTRSDLLLALRERAQRYYGQEQRIELHRIVVDAEVDEVFNFAGELVRVDTRYEGRADARLVAGQR